MKSLLVLFGAIAAEAAMAQLAWSHLLEPNVRRVRITDVLEDPAGYTLLASAYGEFSSPRGKCSMVRLGQGGEFVFARHFGDESASTSASILLNSSLPPRIIVLGSIDRGAVDASYFYYAMSQGLDPIDSNEFVFSGITGPSMDNALMLPGGTGIVAAMGGSTSGDGWPNAHLLLRTTVEGDSLDSDVRASTGTLIPRDILITDPDTILVSTLGIFNSPFLQEWSFGSYSKFNQDLDLVGGFISRPFDGSSGPIAFGNTLFDALHLSRLASRNLVISGRPSGSNNVRTVILKLGPNGDWKAVFAPESEFPMDYPAALRSSLLVGNEVWLASMENFDPGLETGSFFLPDHPNQVKIFKLDTALNVICTNIVDGFAENAYYWVDRIKATSDGGYLLCGGRFDLDQPNSRLVGWVQKFGPADCFTSIEEGFHDLDATVSPNPGADRMRVQLNGPIVSAFVSLWDMNGREVAHAALRGNSADVDTKPLKSGVYAYRVTDAQGELRASGRWVKAE
ncbi:MAG: T9SS type A sorting domain-containing protein [Flavobacteriales bacterium]|nr:T9SS type A sorting domain-containing protein [Flavobacteriales bacterium]